MCLGQVKWVTAADKAERQTQLSNNSRVYIGHREDTLEHLILATGGIVLQGATESHLHKTTILKVSAYS